MIMKKLLLMMVAFLATMSVSAKESGEDAMKWMKNFAPVADKANLDGLHTAVAPDGAVYASTTYDKVFEFAGKNITDPEGLLSSCIVKYDAEGNEMWALPFIGKCVINAMTVDTDGILYVTGNYTDEAVSCTCTDGVTVEIAGSTEATAAFVAQISAQGVITAVRTFMPVANIPDGYEIDSVECDELFQEKTWIYIGPDNENLIISQLPDYANIYIDNERSESEAFALGNLEGVLYDFRDELVCVIQYESTVITISGPVDRDELTQIIRGMNIPE